jgi:hypothetical protein
MASAYKLENITEEFNKCLKKLVSIIGDTIQGESVSTVSLFETARRKINLMVNTDPVYMLESAGDYLYKYRDVITTGDFDDFIMNTQKYIVEDDRQKLEGKIKDVSKEELNCAESLIGTLRSKWGDFSDKEKRTISKHVKKMLSEYCKYLIYNINN